MSAHLCTRSCPDRLAHLTARDKRPVTIEASAGGHMTELTVIKIVLTLAVEDSTHLDEIVDEVRDLAGGHPAVLTIEVER